MSDLLRSDVRDELDARVVALFALFFRPVGFDYRNKREDPRWRTAWDWALFIGGFVPALVFGVAFGNLLQGVPFAFDTDLRVTYHGGFFGLLNPFAVLCGLVSVSMLVAHGAAFVVGHAFGNRVARMLATDRPDLVRAVALIAANVGHAPSPPVVREAIKASANPALPDAERLAALQFAFFAPGNDARSWLKGWHPDVLAAQRVAGDRTARAEDYAGGQAPILYLQPDHDPLAHVEEADEFKRAMGDRVTVVVIRNCSHAAVAEQPDAISDALIDYVNTLWPKD